MPEILPCVYCNKPTPIDQPGASYSEGGIDPSGEYNDPSIMCAACLKYLNEWCENEGRRLDAEMAADAARAAASEQWRKQWPMHCAACAGWGGHSYTENHGMPGPGETIFDPCDAGPPELCHRCGMHGLDDESAGPCRVCGWNFDDGDPGA